MRKRLLLVILIALLAIPLILVVADRLEGEVSLLVWYAVWLGDHIFKAIPQFVFWILLLATAVVLAMSSLVRRRKKPFSAEASGRGQLGQVQRMAQTIRRRSQGAYFKRQVAQSLRPLVLEAGRRQGLSATLSGGDTPAAHREALPPEIQAFLVAGSEIARPVPERLSARIKRLLLRRSAASPLDLDFEVVVRFVEDGLEIAHDR